MIGLSPTSAAALTGSTPRQRAAFQNAGSYAYHCAIHTEMTGTVRVRLNVTGSATQGYTLRWSSLVQTPSKWPNTLFETIRWKSLTRWRDDHCALHTPAAGHIFIPSKEATSCKG